MSDTSGAAIRLSFCTPGSFSLLQTHALELGALWEFCLIDPDNDGKAEDTLNVL